MPGPVRPGRWEDERVGARPTVDTAVEASASGAGRRPRRFRTPALILLAVVLVASTVAIVLRSDSPRSIVPSQGALLGAYVQAPPGATPAEARATVAAFERGIGRPLAIDQHFYPWTSA